MSYLLTVQTNNSVLWQLGTWIRKCVYVWAFKLIHTNSPSGLLYFSLCLYTARSNPPLKLQFLTTIHCKRAAWVIGFMSQISQL